jgi:soluble lytic murein transglycosylase-like protein
MTTMRIPKRVRIEATEAIRTVCDCQVHSRRNKMMWRRSARAVRRTVGGLRARTIAFILSVPLALGALEYPTEAMHLAVTRLPEVAPERTESRAASIVNAVQDAAMQTLSELPIFTTEAVRKQFLTPVDEPQTMSLDTIKEHFFRTQVPYGSIIYREALKNNLPPELVAAVVGAESDFRPRLISHKNAQGLMQIIPSTAEFIGAGDLFNPADNIAAGTKYLRYLYKRFDGDEKMVLAAYNAGEGNVEKFGGIPPFPETINYLDRVSTRTHQYRQRVRSAYVSSMKMRNSLRVY